MKIKNGFKGERMIKFPFEVVEKMENDPVCQLLMITHIGYFPNAKFHFIKRQRGINEYVYIQCVEGSGWIETQKNKFTLGMGQYVVLQADIAHAYGSCNENPWTIYWFHFKGTQARTLLSKFNTPIQLSSDPSDRQMNDRLFEEMYNSVSYGYEIDNLRYLNSVLFHFLGLVLFHTDDRMKAKSNEGKFDKEENICRKVIQYMKANINRDVKLKDISMYAGYKPSHFSVLFHKQIGYSPMAYFILLKMQKAAHFLQATELKVSQIAAKLGYDDYGYFSRLFKKVMGMTPSNYRIAYISSSFN